MIGDVFVGWIDVCGGVVIGDVFVGWIDVTGGVVIGDVFVGWIDVTGGVVIGDVFVGWIDVGGGVREQRGRVMTLSSRLTWPLRARIRPATVLPVCKEADVRAMTVPTNVVSVPRVAELPTCQKTLQACVPLIRATVLLEAVISVDPTWKMNTALGSPSASSVTVPVRPSAESAL